MSCQYENIMLIMDFNLSVENKNLEVFMNIFDLECLIKKTYLLFNITVQVVLT